MPYETGRPPRGSVRYGERFEELAYSDEDIGQGVYAERSSHASRPRDAFAGDELYFDGFDLGQDRQRRRYVYDDRDAEGDDSAEEGYGQRRSLAYQAGGPRGGEDAVLQSAWDRIARATAQGETNFNLSLEEVEALARNRQAQLEPTPALASPPATPAKSKVKGVGGRTSSSTSLVSQKTRKKAGSISSPARSNSKVKVSRKVSNESALPFVPGPGAPGIMVPGPNGVPIYAPIVYGPQSSEALRTQSQSRSSSKNSRRGSTPERNAEQAYASYSPRFYAPSAGFRPPSSSSNRSFQDDVDWYPQSTRHRSSSNVQAHTTYRPDEYDGMPPIPPGQGRWNAGGSPEIRYSSLRRAPPSSSPLAARPAAQHTSHSDPAVGSVRKSSGLSRASADARRTSSGTSSSDDQGVPVQVNVVPDAGNAAGYAIKRVPVPSQGAAAGGIESRKRRTGRR
nr:hypothetical protein CFP56_04334 [Quercus suber]